MLRSGSAVLIVTKRVAVPGKIHASIATPRKAVNKTESRRSQLGSDLSAVIIEEQYGAYWT